jgi:hypothetical protein
VKRCSRKTLRRSNLKRLKKPAPKPRFKALRVPQSNS